MSDSKRLERIEDKIDKVVEVQSKQGETLAVNTQQLIDHIEGVKQTRELIALKEREVQMKLTPIVDHVEKIETWIKVSKVVSKMIIKVVAVMVLLKGGSEGLSALMKYLGE